VAFVRGVGWGPGGSGFGFWGLCCVVLFVGGVVGWVEDYSKELQESFSYFEFQFCRKVYSYGRHAPVTRSTSLPQFSSETFFSSYISSPMYIVDLSLVPRPTDGRLLPSVSCQESVM